MGQKKFISFIWIIGLITLIALYSAAYLLDLSFAAMTMDTIKVKNPPLYAGILSNLGFVFWAFALAFCFLSYLICYQQNKRVGYFFLYAGGLTAIFLADDLFYLHEKVWNRVISEFYLFGVYGCLVLFFVYQFSAGITRSPYFLLSLGLLLLAVIVDISDWTDWINNQNLPDIEKQRMLNWAFLLQDGSGFLGICFWATYLAEMSLHYCQKTLKAKYSHT